MAAVAVGRASYTWGDLCSRACVDTDWYLPSTCTFFKSIYKNIRTWVHVLQGTCVFSKCLFKRIKAFFYTVENKMCSYSSAPFFHYLYFQRRVQMCTVQMWGVSSFSTGAQVLIWHSWYCTFARGSVVLAKQSEWWASAQLLWKIGSAHTKQSPVNLLLFLFPTKRNCYISRMFKNCNNSYTLVNNRVTTSV